MVDENGNRLYGEDSTELQELQQNWWAEEEKKRSLFQNVVSDIERRTGIVKRNLQRNIEYYDYAIAKEQALVDAQQKQYETQDKIREIRRDLKAQLASSKALEAYLDPDSRRLLFNEDDYKAMSSVVDKIDNDIVHLQKKYARDISSLTEDNFYLEEAITKEYERRLASKEREYDIAKKQLDLSKKQQELDNILAEKNVRLLVGGQWTQVANMEEVRRATEEFVSMEEEMSDIRRKNEQQDIMDRKQARVDNMGSERSAVENRVKMIDEQTEKMQIAMDEYLDPIKSTSIILDDVATIGVPRFRNAVNRLTSIMGSVGFGGSIPAYASGTLSAVGGMSLVGEKGPELRVLSRGDGIIPADATKNLMAWSGIRPDEFGFMKYFDTARIQGLLNRQSSKDISQSFAFYGDIKTDGDPEKFLSDVFRKARSRLPIMR